MNDDLISRQAAIDALGEEPYVWTDDDEFTQGTRHQWKNYHDAIEALPSAQSERKHGKWIPHREKSREYIGTVLINVEYDYWLCDTCGYRVKNGQPTYNFCPNCGARMDERKEE